MMFPGQTGTWPMVEAVDEHRQRRRQRKVATFSAASSGITKQAKPPGGVSAKLAWRSLLLIVIGYMLVGLGFAREVSQTPDRAMVAWMNSQR